MRKTFEVLPVGTILQKGDIRTLPPLRSQELCLHVGTRALSPHLRPIAPKKRETITHEGVEYDAEPALMGYSGHLACRPDGLTGEPYKTTYHAPVIEDPEAPNETAVLALAADSWEDEARWIEWAKLEIARLREELGESS